MRRVLALLLLATPAAAQDVRYSATCGMAYDDTAITLRGDLLIFHEAECRMTNGEAVRDMPGAALFDLVCEGEGEQWTERAFLQPSFDGGLILVRRQFAQTVPRCP
jgi:hypothetical protein